MGAPIRPREDARQVHDSRSALRQARAVPAGYTDNLSLALFSCIYIRMDKERERESEMCHSRRALALCSRAQQRFAEIICFSSGHRRARARAVLTCHGKTIAHARELAKGESHRCRRSGGSRTARPAPAA